MFFVVDRIEEDNIVVEMLDRRTVNIPKAMIPEAKEGDVLTIAIDYEETERRRKEAQDIANDVFED